MYPTELEINDMTESNTSASHLDLLLSIERDGQLRIPLYDKHDDFNFNITNFPFLSSNIPSSPAYGVFISQLRRFARTCSSYECFIRRTARLLSKLLGQGYVMERFNSSLRNFFSVDMGISSNIMKSPSPKCYMTFWDITIYDDTLQLIRHDANLRTYYRTKPYDQCRAYNQMSEVSVDPPFCLYRALQRVRLANRGRWLLQTPGPVPVWTCICSNVDTIFS